MWDSWSLTLKKMDKAVLCLIITSIVLFHVIYPCLLRRMKAIGLDAPYAGQFLNYWTNLRRYEEYCRDHDQPFGSLYWLLRVSQYVGLVAAVVFLSIRLFR